MPEPPASKPLKQRRVSLVPKDDPTLPRITPQPIKRKPSVDPANPAKPAAPSPPPEELVEEDEVFVAHGADDPFEARTPATPATPEPPVEVEAREEAPEVPAGAAAKVASKPEPVVSEKSGEQIIRHKAKRKKKTSTTLPPAPKVGAMLLHTHRLRKVYDGRAVVNGVEINVREGEIVGLLGPNGAGKTTSFYMIVGLIQPNGGSVVFNGADMTHEPMYKRARLGMGYLPQEESIFRKLSVQDNIMAVLETQTGLNRKQRRERCQALMEQFGIEKLARNTAITLSGGEKRRLTIARSLVTNPKLLMLDEPFSGVDPIAVEEIKEIIESLRQDGLAILITDHNVQDTLDIVDRAYLLFEGVVRREGTREFLINDPLSRELYLGSREY
ncbi:MAG: LPS export ABC transporter ATP-binding protein [Verrucomicrobiota bacterium]